MRVAEFLRMRQDPALENTEAWLDPEALNGYVAFPKRHAPRLPVNYQNLVQYMPIHGGVTYVRKDSYAAVWGFDTMHLDSAALPRTDCDWMRRVPDFVLRVAVKCEAMAGVPARFGGPAH